MQEDYLIGNSRDKVYMKGGRVFKESKDASIMHQMNFLLENKDSFFIKIQKEIGFAYSMPYYKTFVEWATVQPDWVIVDKFAEMVAVVSGMESEIVKMDWEKYQLKVQDRFGLYIDIPERLFGIDVKKGMFHGDFTLSNVLMNGDDFIFIDPRGTVEYDLFDYGKMMMSADLSYESLLYGKGIRKQVRLSMSKLLQMKADEDAVNLMYAMHLFSVVPFLFELHRPYVELFLARGYDIIDNLGLTYEKTT